MPALESSLVSDRWWEGAVLYQIYPRSFADANGDGIGDLAGILAHLDHVGGTDASLGVDAIWLSPIYPSPLADFGYDISDYTGVAAEFGTLADLDALIGACHERGLRLLMDLVPCHTSVEHPWFVESRSSRTNPKRDWYLWADPGAGGGPPSNWNSIFGGSAWTWDPATEQFYLHSFYPEQPDLNWRNPEVAEAIAQVMRFWLARGVDGFRVDAIPAAIKDDRLRDNPPFRRPGAIPGLTIGGEQDPLWSMNRPEVHDVIRHLRRVAAEFPGRVLVGEAYLPVEELAAYLGSGSDPEFDLAFDFELLLSPWEHRDLALAIERSEALHPPASWPTFAISNHDQPRHATRWGEQRTRAAAFLLLTLRGVAVLYAGEEIGMVDADPSVLPDPPFDRAGRDGSRTPMQWDRSPTGWLHDRPAVAAGDRSGGPQRRRPVRRSGVAALPLSAPDRGSAGGAGAGARLASVALRRGARRAGVGPRAGWRAGARAPQRRRSAADLRAHRFRRRRRSRGRDRSIAHRSDRARGTDARAAGGIGAAALSVRCYRSSP